MHVVVRVSCVECGALVVIIGRAAAVACGRMWAMVFIIFRVSCGCVGVECDAPVWK
jgi:hypothetical protein